MFNLSLFAERLEDLMIENNLSSSAFADILGIDDSSVNNYLSGKFTPHTNNLIKIADYFHCPTDYLLGFGDDFTPKAYRECPPFSERLKFLLNEKHYSQYKLNKDTKIAESLITLWIRGKFIPNADNLIKLAKFFDCSVDYVLGRSN